MSPHFTWVRGLEETAAMLVQSPVAVSWGALVQHTQLDNFAGLALAGY